MASHLKTSLRLSLTDLSPRMLELSASINPECEHHVGDMRSIRLGRTFDAVLVHDAICYMTTETDLCATFDTAFEHLRPGGAAVLARHVSRDLREGTDHGARRARTRAADPRAPLPRMDHRPSAATIYSSTTPS